LITHPEKISHPQAKDPNDLRSSGVAGRMLENFSDLLLFIVKQQMMITIKMTNPKRKFCSDFII
jgi:hypothetical protein